MNADVYVAKTSGTYFSMPKCAKGIRTGKTYLDVYKLFSKEELAETNIDIIREKTDKALLFDAYKEQEGLLVKYKNNNNLEGLQNVLYMCPHCGTEFSIDVKDKNTIFAKNVALSR